MRRNGASPVARNGVAANGAAAPASVRCAIYGRKSVEERIATNFGSIEAQREAGESYITSQRHEGWTLVPDYYDDGGFSGGSMERPALKKLMRDIENGQIDVVVVYKVDRLSRSLSDFAKLIDLFDKHNVSFVSVTQQFNTTTSMGRLTLNILLSFAQFEREVIGERIRDKVAATKRGTRSRKRSRAAPRRRWPNARSSSAKRCSRTTT